uniref:Uncharacterized protein n=1 Tax=Aegilops tauschii subsp. strangulata TaxID=200361 RepID=A0A452XIY5_AEGTS
MCFLEPCWSGPSPRSHLYGHRQRSIKGHWNLSSLLFIWPSPRSHSYGHCCSRSLSVFLLLPLYGCKVRLHLILVSEDDLVNLIKRIPHGPLFRFSMSHNNGTY